MAGAGEEGPFAQVLVAASSSTPGVRLVVRGPRAEALAARLSEAAVLARLRKIIEEVSAEQVVGEPAREPEVSASRPITPFTEPPAEAYEGVERLSTLGGFTGRRRVARAFWLGVADRETKEMIDAEGGRQYQQAATPIPGRSRAYVVLRGASGEAAWWTSQAEHYHNETHEARGARSSRSAWKDGVVSRAFLSEVEARAYCIGAQLGGLPARQP